MSVSASSRTVGFEHAREPRGSPPATGRRRRRRPCSAWRSPRRRSPHGVAHRAHDLAREAGPVLEAPPHASVAAIQLRGEERARADSCGRGGSRSRRSRRRRGRARRRANCRRDRRRAPPSVAARVRRIPSGLKTRDGARLGASCPTGLATGPAWPSCADAAAPSAWIASVSRRSPGPISGWSSIELVPVGAPRRATPRSTRPWSSPRRPPRPVGGTR